MKDQGFFLPGTSDPDIFTISNHWITFCIINPDKITYVVEQHIVTKKLVDLQVI